MAESEVVSSYSWNLCGSYRRREFLFMYFQFNFYSIYWNFKNRTLYKGSVFCFPFSCDKTGGSFMKIKRDNLSFGTTGYLTGFTE